MMGWDISSNLKSKEKSLYRYNLKTLQILGPCYRPHVWLGPSWSRLGDEGAELGWAMPWEGLGAEKVCELCRRVPSRPFTEPGWPSSGLNFPKCHL